MAFNRLADSQSKQLAALSVEHGGDTALTVNIGVSDGRAGGGIPGPLRGLESDSALGLGSSLRQHPVLALLSSNSPCTCVSPLTSASQLQHPWAVPPLACLPPDPLTSPRRPSHPIGPRTDPCPLQTRQPCGSWEPHSQQCLKTGKWWEWELVRRCLLPISQTETLRVRKGRQLAHSNLEQEMEGLGFEP